MTASRLSAQLGQRIDYRYERCSGAAGKTSARHYRYDGWRLLMSELQVTWGTKGKGRNAARVTCRCRDYLRARAAVAATCSATFVAWSTDAATLAWTASVAWRATLLI